MATLLLLTPPAMAATIQVTTSADENGAGGTAACSLREAIGSANTNANVGGCVGVGAYGTDQITFAVGTDGAPTVLSLGTLAVTSDLQILGNGATLTTVHGNNAVRVFLVDTGVTAEFAALTIRNGSVSGPGAGIGNLGTLTISDTTLSNNTATASGGGIYNAPGATLTLTDSTLTGNTAPSGSGGGIANDGGGILGITGSTLSTNSAANGGGIYNLGEVTVTDSALTGNSATSLGGGIVNDSGGTVEITGSTLSTNSAVSGGAIYNLDEATVTDSTLTNNSAASGAGIYSAAGATLDVTGSMLTDNDATNGGAIYTLGTTTVATSTLSGNAASGAGGAIVVDAGGSLTSTGSTLSTNTATNGGGVYIVGAVMLTDSTLSGNAATSLGGGIAIDTGGTLTSTGSTLSGNSATNGGGIYSVGTATLTNSTFSGNSATNFGGGLVSDSGGTATFTNATLSGNSAANGSGIANLATVTLRASIIARAATASNCFGAMTTQGFNVANDGSCSPGGSDVVVALGAVGLGPLANNGGPTLTHALLETSPAIDAVTGSCAVAADQRGISRPQDGNGDATALCDSGAFEVNRAQDFSANISVAATLDTAGPYAPGQSISYTVLISNVGPNAATSVQLTATPTNLTIASVSGSGCAALPCTVTSLASSASTSVTIVATIDAAGPFDAAFSVDATEADPGLTDNTDGTGNGGVAVAFTPTPTATETATPTATATATPTETFTPTPTETATSTATGTPSLTPTLTTTTTPSPTPTGTLVTTITPTPTSTPTSTFTPSPTSTLTPTPSSTPTLTATPSPTGTSTATPTLTSTPTLTPSTTPIVTVTATASATLTPTVSAAPAAADSGRVPDGQEDSPGRKTEEQRQQEQLTNRSNRSDVATEGNVMELQIDNQGLTLVIANLDGRVVIHLRCVTACPTVRVGDYVEVTGEKVSEQQYEAELVTVVR